MRRRMASRITAEAAVRHAMFVEQIPMTEKTLRTVIVYALTPCCSGSPASGAGEHDTFDVIVIFLLSNVVQSAVNGNDTSFYRRG
jgi:hypothetical protein